MKALELKKHLYWNGTLDPDLKTFDIIMETKFGTTYNSYILKGSEKTALIETSKLKFFDSYLETVESVVAITDVDYIIVNHTEPDHVGSVEKLLALNPNIQIVGSTAAINFLKNIVNHDFTSIAVKENDTLSLGDQTLKFLSVPYLHWPDTMYTYWEEGQVLFTCDSFGAHYSHEGILRSTVTNEADYAEALKYYFDNIIGPFKLDYMTKAMTKIKDLKIDMICTGHGPVIDTHIKELMDLYHSWCDMTNPNLKKTIIIAYVSAYGYTEELAQTIASTITENYDIDVHTYNMETADLHEVLQDITFADGLLLGSPTIVCDALPPIWDITMNMCSPMHKGKLASAFGSYGWSGEAVPNLIERLKQLKCKTVDGYRIKLKPSTQDLQGACEFAKDFASRL